MLDVEKLAEATAELIAEHVAAAIEPLQARLAEIEQRPPAPAENNADLIRQAVADAVAAIPPARDGRDADPAEIEAMVRAAVAAIPPPADGLSVTVDDVSPLIEEQVARAVAALPPVENGKDADPAEIVRQVRAAVAELPLPVLQPEDVRPLIDEQVGKAVAALPAAKDGVGLASALIDRAGDLVVPLTNGEVRSLGPVVGRDADIGPVMSALQEAVAAIPQPINGRDGLGFDDLEIEQSGERTFVFRFVREDQRKEWSFDIPVVIDRGVFKAGQDYAAGDAVTWAGSLWIARAATAEKPGDGDGWRLAVKRGRDGKDAGAR